MLHTAKRYWLGVTKGKHRNSPERPRKPRRTKSTLGALAALLLTIPPQFLPTEQPGGSGGNDMGSKTASQHATQTFLEDRSATAITAGFVHLERGANGPVRRISTHWAGYVDTGGPGSFTAVQATWVQPRIRCDRPNGSAAFWIGLGGATASADGLEQIGTSADCSDDFLPSYSAWYELIPIPAAPIELPITVAPGDTLTAQISARDTTVTLSIRNLTSGSAFSTQITAPRLDLSSAEWIAEAPSFCAIDCTRLPLADFGSVTFKSATASAEAHSGTISDPAWTYQPIKLITAPEQPAALPSVLSTDGQSFSIRWRDTTRRRRHHPRRTERGFTGLQARRSRRGHHSLQRA